MLVKSAEEWRKRCNCMVSYRERIKTFFYMLKVLITYKKYIYVKALIKFTYSCKL
jgi:hypothetical protein